MMKWKLENDTVIQKSSASIKKKLIVVGMILLVMLIGVFFADDWQQRRVATLKYGYNCMEQCRYEETIVAFEEYLNMDSDIYWYLLELINDESYSRKNVYDCLEKCTEKQLD